MYYLVDGIRSRLSLTERAAELFRLHRKYHPQAVGYEKYGMQADVEHIRYMQERLNYRFGIIELGGAMPKPDRIRRLIPVFEQGRFWLPRALPFTDGDGRPQNLSRLFTEEEYKAFPVSEHDDMLDCLARILDPELGASFPLAFARDFNPVADLDWKPF